MAEQTFKLVSPDWRARVEDFPSALAWTADGSAVVVGCGEGQLLRLEAHTGDITHAVQAHAMGLLSLAGSMRAPLVATGGQEKIARLWDASTLEPRAALPAGPTSSVDIVCFAPNAPVLATACGKHVAIWESDGAQRVAFPPHEFTVSAICWSPDGRRLATAAFDAIRIWDATTGELLRNYETRTSILSLAWKPNDEILVGGTQDATMLIWNLREEDAFQAGPFEMKVKDLAFHYSGKSLLSGGGCDVTLWDFSSGDMQGEKPEFLAAHQEMVTAIGYQRVGPLAASGGRDGAVYFWRPGSATMPLQYVHFEEEITALAWHPRDSHVAIATSEGSIAVIAAPGRR